MAESRKNGLIAAATLAGVLGLAAWRLLAPLTQAGQCDLGAETCALQIGDRQLEAELLPRPAVAGQPLRLVLRPAAGSDLPGETLQVDFSMPGMDMGRHTMVLRPAESGVLEGRITLPNCPMGSTWQASIQLASEPAAGAPEPETLVLHLGQAPGQDVGQ